MFSSFKFKIISYCFLILILLFFASVIFIVGQHFFILKLKTSIYTLTEKIEKIENDNFLLKENFKILQNQILKIKKINETKTSLNEEISLLKDRENVIKIHNKIVNSFNMYSSF